MRYRAFIAATKKDLEKQREHVTKQLRDAGLEVNHAFRRWLIGTVKLGYGLDDYVGMARIDNRYLASAALTYKLTRSVQIKGEVRQEWLRSNIPGTDYTATVALIGLRLQR